MPRKNTLEEVQEICREHGFEFVDDEYHGYTYKHNIKCRCGTVFLTNICNISRGHTKSCGYCKKRTVRYSLDEIQRLCKTLGFEFVDSNFLGCHYKHLVKCHCGKVFDVRLNSILTKKQISCGCKKNQWKRLSLQNVKLICLESGFTLVEKDYVDTHNLSVICRCGNVINTSTYSITSGKTKSCGHCNDPKVGDRFGSLTVIQIKPANTGGCQAKCICDCGKETGWKNASVFVNGNTMSCGKCQNKRNGQTTSNLALTLQSQIENLTGLECEHNHHLLPKRKCCVDIYAPSLNIAIELDSLFWHRIKVNALKKDIRKRNKILKLGHKLLVIKTNSELPTDSQLQEMLSFLITAEHTAYAEIATADWFEAAQKKLGHVVV